MYVNIVIFIIFVPMAYEQNPSTCIIVSDDSKNIHVQHMQQLTVVKMKKTKPKLKGNELKYEWI